MSLVSTELHSSDRVKKKIQQKIWRSSVNRRMSYSCFEDVKGNSCGQEQVSWLTNSSSLIITYLRDIQKRYQYPSFEQKGTAGFFIFEGRHHLRRMVYLVSVHMSTTCSDDIDSPTCSNLKGLLFENRHQNYRKCSACITSQN